MKITHIITRLIVGGAQENTLLNVEGLARQFSDEVDLITGPPLGAEGSLLEDAEKRGIRLRVIPEIFHTTFSEDPESMRSENLPEKGHLSHN